LHRLIRAPFVKMPVPVATLRTFRMRLSAFPWLRRCLFSILCLIASFLPALLAPAQPFQLRVRQPASNQLTPPQVDLVSGTTASRIEQARALAASKNWDEAVDIYLELANDDSGNVVALDDGRYVSLQTYGQMQLAKMPAEGLVAYRRRADPLAERWYREGIASRDESKLQLVVDKSFCSSWGDDALLALGELALERGDIESARHWWDQISPMIRDPLGRPLWIALRNIDIGKRWADIDRIWRSRPNPPTWLAYPDTDINLADIRARLILAAIRAGELDRATLELDVFRRQHPTASGRLGGQDGPYVAALDRLLTAARSWPDYSASVGWTTFAGSQTRDGIAPPLPSILVPEWSQPVPLNVSDRLTTPNTTIVLGGRLGGNIFLGPQQPSASKPMREAQQPLECFPIVVGNAVVYSDGIQVRAVEAASGRAAITNDGVLHREMQNSLSTETRNSSPQRLRYQSAYGAPRNTLTFVNGVAYARVGPPATVAADARQTASGARLIGIDLRRDGLMTFNSRPSDDSYAFDGAPVSDGERVWIALRRSESTPHAYVACYDATSGAELWRTSIGATDSLGAGRGDEITHDLLTFVGGRLYFNSNLGLVAALDANSGQVIWLHRYGRASAAPMPGGRYYPLHFDRDPSPCLYHQGLVIVAPADSPSVFALDAVTGQKLWNTYELPDALHLLGVVKNNLVVTGNRFALVDVRSGTRMRVWPESEYAGIRGRGRGLIAGEEVFWPTRTDIYVLHAVTGQRTRSPISLKNFSDAGANLAAAHNRLIIAGQNKLVALAAPTLTTEP
jgi:hypothetical protein